MSLAAYIALALVAGLAWGTSLGYLLNAPRKKSGELQQWIALAVAMLVVMGCAVIMKQVGDLAVLDIPTKASAALAFLISFGAAFLRCKVKM